MGLRMLSTANELKIKFYLFNDVINSGALNITFANVVHAFIVAKNKNCFNVCQHPNVGHIDNSCKLVFSQLANAKGSRHARYFCNVTYYQSIIATRTLCLEGGLNSK